MRYDALKQEILDLPLGKRIIVYKIDENTEIFVHKPEKVPTKLKQGKRYDANKNFQIGLKKTGNKEFLPNHLRILLDLDLKRKENKKDFEIVFDALEKIYAGEDPLDFKDILTGLTFQKEIENAMTDVCLTQLFMLEQDINYHFGKIQPPRSYLMGYIRMINAGIEEIDKLLWSSTRHPPRKEFRE